jgi:hypothetical protein
MTFRIMDFTTEDLYCAYQQIAALLDAHVLPDSLQDSPVHFFNSDVERAHHAPARVNAGAHANAWRFRSRKNNFTGRNPRDESRPSRRRFR